MECHDTNAPARACWLDPSRRELIVTLLVSAIAVVAFFYSLHP